MSQANFEQVQKQFKEVQARVTIVDTQRQAAITQGKVDADHATRAEASVTRIEANSKYWQEEAMKGLRGARMVQQLITAPPSS